MFINFIVFIAVFTFCGFAVLTKCSDISNVTNIWPNIGKTATIVFSIVLIFEKWAWKWKLLHGWLIPTPNIKGEWVGHMKYKYENKVCEKDFEVSIIQSFLYISISIKTDESKSDSVTASFDIDKERGIRNLIYTYRNEPKIGLRKRSPIHYGTASLSISDDFNKMEGYYWTDRDSQGELTLKKKN